MRMNRYTLTLTILLSVFVGAAMLPGDLGAQVYTVKNYFTPCSGVSCDNVFEVGGTVDVASGAELDVESGGEIDIESGARFEIAGSDRAAVLATAPAAVAAGYKIARGTVTLDGSNPSSATSGLATIVACTVTNKRSTAPGLDPTEFTIATAAVAGRLDVYAWKPTASGDATLVASTDADDTIDWVCVGT